jgi:molybdenum-dependent DNA-binding transcriptional regulator ModE
LSGFGRFWQVLSGWREKKMENDERILSALLTSGTIAEAAKKCGLSERTIYRRIADVGFRAEWRSARRALVESAVGLIQSGMNRAAQTLLDSLDDEKAAIRVRASNLVLERGDKGLETFDVIERVEQIEVALELRKQ